MTPELAVKLGPEFVGVLLNLDVDRFRAMKRQAEPHLPELSASDALVALHMVRCMVPAIKKKAREYSAQVLKEYGLELRNGRWEQTAERAMKVFAESVGVASMRSGGGKGQFNRDVEHVMSDAVLDSIAKGIREPQVQKENMMKARGKLRFRKRLD